MDLRWETHSLPRNIARSSVRVLRGPEVTAAQLTVWAILNGSTHQHFCSTGSAKTVNVPTQTDTFLQIVIYRFSEVSLIKENSH